MTKLIIDPSLFEIPDNMSKSNQLEHYMFLKECINFVSEFFQVTLDEYDGAPYCGNSESSPYAPPITKSLTVRNNYSSISKEIQKMVNQGHWIDLPDKSINNCSLKFEDLSAAEEKFKKYLYYVFDTGVYKESLLLLSKKNFACTPAVTVSINENTYYFSSIYNPAIDCSGIVKDYLKPSTDSASIFPQYAACSKLNDSFKFEIDEGSKSTDEKKAIYIKYGTEVAYRNCYQKKPDISRKNPKYEVFVHSLGNFYLSIDREHGGLELFRNQGKHANHMGEYDFSCVLIKGPEPETHKLIV